MEFSILFVMKQAIVIRADIGMSIGKVAAQACHASLASAFAAPREDISHWLEQGSTKIILQAPSLEALLALQERSRSIDLSHVLISDAGRTEIPQGTVTALAIGPSEDRMIDTVTGDLPLLK